MIHVLLAASLAASTVLQRDDGFYIVPTQNAQAQLTLTEKSSEIFLKFEPKIKRSKTIRTKDENKKTAIRPAKQTKPESVHLRLRDTK